MSYDLTLIRVNAGADAISVAHALAAYEEQVLIGKVSAPPSGLLMLDQSLREQIVLAAMKALPGLERQAVVGTATESGSILLNERRPDIGLQIGVSEHSVSVSIAYWKSGAESQTVMASVWRCLDAMAEVGNLRVVDHQLDRVLDAQGGPKALTEGYLQSAGVAQAVLGKHAADGAKAIAAPGQSPWRASAIIVVVLLGLALWLVLRKR